MGWHRLLWASLAIPKHVIIAWMAILNKLPTKDRLTSWGMDVDMECVLCHHESETRSRLLFGCSFSVTYGRRFYIFVALEGMLQTEKVS